MIAIKELKIDYLLIYSKMNLNPRVNKHVLYILNCSMRNISFWYISPNKNCINMTNMNK